MCLKCAWEWARASARTAVRLIEQWIASPLGVFRAACCFCFVASQWACVYWGGICMHVGGKCVSFWMYVCVCVSGEGLEWERSMPYSCQALEQHEIRNRFLFSLRDGNYPKQSDCLRWCSKSYMYITLCQSCLRKTCWQIEDSETPLAVDIVIDSSRMTYWIKLKLLWG